MGMRTTRSRWTAGAAAFALGAALLSGCGSREAKVPANYDFYIFNGKSENAQAMEEVVDRYEAETGLTIKLFSLGTTDVAETLRSEMNSSGKPALFSTNIGGVMEWSESGAILDLNEASNPELKALAADVPEALRLSADGSQNYGIPYNIEGYGLIVDTRMAEQLFDLKNPQSFLEDFKAATYDEFENLVNQVEAYIATGQAEEVELNGNSYGFAAAKTELTSRLTGVFAEAGAEKWTYGDHMGNMAMNAVFGSAVDARNASEEQVDELEAPLEKLVRTLDLYSSRAAGMDGPLKRGPSYINSTTASYDVSVQLFSSGKALFLKQGNWVYPNIEKLNADILPTLTFLPIKLPLEQGDIKVEGLTVEKFNRSVPEFVPSYYAINTKVTKREQELAQQFLVWLNTTEEGRRAVVEDFQFIPYNADESVKFDNALNNSLIEYQLAGDTLSNPFNGSPAGGAYWGQEVFGSILQERYYNREGEWMPDDYRTIAEQAVQGWKDVMY
ncbi:sugar ABC transporter substrate-binding protein [Saccharibacillus sp. O23]|uniref:ABC transporter substrate-binding protein n=1 Tax=Saccharibacillus sp. O23 TaxID=2009338 RepID=UPI000B4E169A|nr:ABC transporter substrate-binding protein [Saccharibacillus sp. O23]OWR30697.1 sugar ABC transporter substrate-binding protein [Saccharibacillus sp. O23]